MINKYNKNSIVCISLFIVVAFKVYIFYGLSVISNDCLAYINIASNIFENRSVQGIKFITHFPPAYPFILRIEKEILQTWDNAFLFNYLIIGSITSVIVYSFFNRNFSRWRHISFFPLVMLYPIFLTSRSILDSSSEYTFAFVVWIAIFFFFEFIHRNNHIRNLIFSNSLFLISYLLRPEGMVLFGCFGINLLYVYKINTLRPKILLSYLIPFLVIALPYIFYLYIVTGKLMLTGKEDAVLANVNLMYPGTFSKMLALFDVFISPHFINPIVGAGLIFFIINLLRKKYQKKDSLNIKLLLFPTVFFLLVLTFRYTLHARAIYVLIPSFLIFSFLGWQEILNNRIFSKIKSYFYVGIILFFTVSITIIPFLSSTKNHPILYRNAANVISKDINNGESIVSRDIKLRYHLPGINIIFPNDSIIEANGGDYVIYNASFSTNIIPKYILLSNLDHVSLQHPSKYEINNINSTLIKLNGFDYSYIKDVRRGEYFVRIFKLLNQA